MKVERVVLGQRNEASARGRADADDFTEEVGEHTTIRIASAAGGQSRIRQRTEIPQARIGELAPKHAEDVVKWPRYKCPRLAV